jgi:hypothetical protein
MRIYRLLFLIAFLLFSFVDDNLPSKIQDALLAYYKTHPREKISIQTDQTFYVTGQTIWYKVLGIAYNESTDISKVVYVQLADADGNIILLNKLPLLSATANGDIYLPGTLKSGIYQLRGFTAWMLNFEDQFIFNKAIYVHNAADTTDVAAPKHASRYNILFFPEGGGLVDSNLCHVTFKAADQYGLPAAISGEIVDNAKKKIASLTVIHDGMGDFNIRPLPGQNYTAIVHFPDGSIQTATLPLAKPSGISIKIAQQREDEFDIDIACRGVNTMQFSRLVLAACQSNGKAATFPLPLHRGVNRFIVPIKDFDAGVLQLTFFDANSTPRAERLMFIPPKKMLQTTLVKDATAPGAFGFTVRDKNGTPVKGNFSVAVTDAALNNADTMQQNIFSSVLLSAELTGFVYNPTWYFSANNDSTRKSLDLLMQTSDWKRFKWDDVLKNKNAPLKYEPEQDLYAAGQISDYSKIPGGDQLRIQLLMQKTDSSAYVGSIEPSGDGKFLLSNYNFTGLSKLYFVATNNNKPVSGINIKFFTSPVDSIRSVPANRVPLLSGGLLASAAWHNYIAKQKASNSKAMAIAQRAATRPGKPLPLPPLSTEELIEQYTSSYFETPGTYSIDVSIDSVQRLPGFFQLIKQRIPALNITGMERAPQFALANTATANAATSSNAQRYPYFYINEILVPYESVRTVPLENIALVRYISPPFLMAPLKGGTLGAIAVYLKKGKSVLFKKSVSTKNITPFLFNGYNSTRRFNNTVNKTDNDLLTAPQEGSTIYWNANLMARTSGEYHFSFKKSNTVRDYRVTIEGMAEDGTLVHFSTVVKND